MFNNNQSVIDCIFRNQSDIGARLKVASVVSIPDEFSLRIMDDPPRGCRIVWRSAQEIGVAYSDFN